MNLLDMDRKDEHHLFKKQRQWAQDAFSRAKIPAYLESILSHEYRSDTSLRTPFQHQRHILEGCEKSVIVFLNGNLRLDLSSVDNMKNSVIHPFTKAARSYAPLIESFHATVLHSEKDPLLLFNLMTYQDGLFLYIPPYTHLERPLQILHLVESSELLQASSRIHLVLGHEASITLLETSLHEGTHKTLHLSSLTCELAENAHLQHAYFDLSERKTHSVQGTFLRSSLKKASSLESTSLLQGPFHEHSQKIVLQGEDSSVKVQGAWVGDEEDQLRTTVCVDHKNMRCRSRLLFNGVVLGKATSIFEGTITIHEKASLSEAHEMNRNLILDEGSKAISTPNLIIHADDVKAQHGVTYGKLDQEALLYMRSRGISKEAAEKMLIRGFLQEVLQEAPHPAMRKRGLL